MGSLLKQTSDTLWVGFEHEQGVGIEALFVDKVGMMIDKITDN